MKYGIKLTMEDVSEMTGVAVSTLFRWRKNDPKLFAVIWRGCVEMKLDEIRRVI